MALKSCFVADESSYERWMLNDYDVTCNGVSEYQTQPACMFATNADPWAKWQRTYLIINGLLLTYSWFSPTSLQRSLLHRYVMYCLLSSINCKLNACCGTRTTFFFRFTEKELHCGIRDSIQVLLTIKHWNYFEIKKSYLNSCKSD